MSNRIVRRPADRGFSITPLRECRSPLWIRSGAHDVYVTLADLAEAIAAEDEADVVRVLERLLAGSENHLRAFERRA
jgi:hypothetical protein